MEANTKVLLWYICSVYYTSAGLIDWPGGPWGQTECGGFDGLNGVISKYAHVSGREQVYNASHTLGDW